VAAPQAGSGPIQSRIKRVYLLAPDFRTLGGFELQLATLASQLRYAGLQVEVFFREPVRASHPYRLQMQASGVRVHAPPAWLAALLNPGPGQRQRVFTIFVVLCAPLLLPITLVDSLLRRRGWRRSWQGCRGWLQARLTPLLTFDGLTGWMQRRLNWARLWRPPDVIDVQHSQLSAGIHYGKQHHIPTVYTEYGAPSADLWPVWQGLVPVINEADVIIGRAEASLTGLRELCAASRPMRLVPNAVTELPDPAQLCPPGRPASHVTITAIGRLSREKGLHVLLEAFSRVAASGAAVRLQLAGEGPLRETLASQAETLGIGGQVHFLGAFASLAPIMRATDIVAHPTLNDGRSVAVLEAMAWGRPVVASRVGGVAELIEDEVSGLLVPARDPAALAEALQRLLADPALRARLGQAARTRFLAGGFTASGMVSATLAAYQLALNSAAAAPTG